MERKAPDGAKAINKPKIDDCTIWTDDAPMMVRVIAALRDAGVAFEVHPHGTEGFRVTVLVTLKDAQS